MNKQSCLMFGALSFALLAGCAGGSEDERTDRSGSHLETTTANDNPDAPYPVDDNPDAPYPINDGDDATQPNPDEAETPGKPGPGDASEPGHPGTGR